MKISSQVVLFITLLGCAGSRGPRGHNSLITFVESRPGCKVALSGVDSDDSKTLETGEISNSAEICDGSDGADGQDGKQPEYTPIRLLNPCGDAPKINDSILIRLADGTVLAPLADKNGKNPRFTILDPDRYETTDGDKCWFTLTAEGEITAESHKY